jgi:hypothetical protein
LLKDFLPVIRIIITLLISFNCSLAIAQTATEVSLQQRQSALVKTIDSLKVMMATIKGCSHFMLTNNPVWINTQTSKTYYRNCKRSETYITLNKDSSFIFISYGEGSNHLQKGRWQMKADSTIFLKGSKTLTESFIKSRRRFQGRNWSYRFMDLLLHIKQDRLLMLNQKRYNGTQAEL